MHKVVKNEGQKPQYFVEDDHEPIIPKAVYYQVQGEKKRRRSLKMDPSILRFGKKLALNGRQVCGRCGLRIVKENKMKAAILEAFNRLPAMRDF